MTISTAASKTIAQGNGATTVFSFNFLVQSADQLAVIYTDANGNATPLAANLYSVSGLGNANGGTVTYPLAGSPIANGTTLTIYRTVSLKQLTSLLNQGSYNPAVVEAALDYLTMIGQQLNENLARAVVAPVEDGSPAMTLPAQAARKSTMLGFDANGVLTLLAALGTTPVSGYMTTMLTEATAAAARGYLGSTTVGDAVFIATTAAVARAAMSAAQSGANGDITSLTAITTMIGHAVTGLLDLSGASAGQIKFPATANSSANANTLDDYEEGTWTPSLGGTATYNANGQTGLYTKIGRQVFVRGYLSINAIGTGSTTQIAGLPFASSSVNNDPQVGYAGNFASAAVSLIAPKVYVISASTTLSVLSQLAASAADVLNNFFGNGTAVTFGMTYDT